MPRRGGIKVAVHSGPLRLFVAALSSSLNAEYSIMFCFFFFLSFFFNIHHPQIWKLHFLSISHGIRISGRANEKLKARRMGKGWGSGWGGGLGREKWICDVMQGDRDAVRGVSRGTREAMRRRVLRGLMPDVTRVGIPRTRGRSSKRSLKESVMIIATRRFDALPSGWSGESAAHSRMCVHLSFGDSVNKALER